MEMRNSKDYEVIIKLISNSILSSSIMEEFEKLDREKKKTKPQDRFLPENYWRLFKRPDYPDKVHLEIMKEWVEKLSEKEIVEVYKLLQIANKTVKEREQEAKNKVYEIHPEPETYRGHVIVPKPILTPITEPIPQLLESIDNLSKDSVIRTLSIVLDYNCEAFHSLLPGKSVYEIDLFTSEFTNSDQIREHFKDEITKYLNSDKAQEVIKAIKKKTGNETCEGSIVVLEEGISTEHSLKENQNYIQIQNKIYYRRAVLYKSDIEFIIVAMKDRKILENAYYVERTNEKKLLDDLKLSVIHRKKKKHLREEDKEVLPLSEEELELLEIWLNKDPELYYEKIRLMKEAHKRTYNYDKKTYEWLKKDLELYPEKILLWQKSMNKSNSNKINETFDQIPLEDFDIGDKKR